MFVPVSDQKRLIHILADDLQPRIDWAYALEQTIALLGGGYLTAGNGDPNGLVTKPEGYLFLDLTTPAVWQNQNGGTVWTKLGAGGGSGLPPQWTVDNTHGDVIATVDDATKSPVTIKGFTGQAASLQEWKDETDTVRVSVGPDGRVIIVGPSGAGNVLSATNDTGDFGATIATTGELQQYVASALASAAWTIKSYPGDRTASPANDLLALGPFGKLELWADTDIPCLVLNQVDNGFTGGVLVIGRSVSGADVFRVAANGAIGTSAVEPADGDINPGECFRWFDPTNGAASVRFKGKTLDGTIVKSTGPMT